MTKSTSASRKVVLITGAARRLGKAIAIELHRRGLDIVIHCGSSIDSAKQLSERFNSLRQNSAVIIQQDLKQIDGSRILIEKTIASFGQLDHLVNNAAIFFPTPFVPASIATEKKLFDPQTLDSFLTVNTRRPIQLMKQAFPYLQKHGGSIVNIIDIYAQAGLSNHCDYVTSKALLWQATKAIAREFSPLVRVNAVSPGAILWPEESSKSAANIQQSIIEKTALKRKGSESDISQAVTYLLLDASYSTGSLINVDGGRNLYI